MRILYLKVIPELLLFRVLKLEILILRKPPPPTIWYFGKFRVTQEFLKLKIFERKKNVFFRKNKLFSDLFLTLFLQVKVWFQNRRTKYKREKMESGEAVEMNEIESPVEDMDDSLTSWISQLRKKSF